MEPELTDSHDVPEIVTQVEILLRKAYIDAHPGATSFRGRYAWAARLLGVTPRTIYRWAHADHIGPGLNVLAKFAEHARQLFASLGE